jgi:NADPH-dependent 2,4-dienoyl-CoA reductase/sulfur reductase-like enzyme
MPNSQRLIVIGGTAAGLSAASKAKRLNPALQVLVFEKTGYISYGACGLPYFVGDLIVNPDNLVSVSVEEMVTKRDISVQIHTEVLSIDRRNKEVQVRNLLDAAVSSYSYDYLVLATGAVPVIPPILGIQTKGVCVLRTVEDGIAMKQRAMQSKRISIIGGGFIGLELAEQLSQGGRSVTLFETLDRLLPWLPASYSERVRQTLEEHGIEVFLGTSVSEVQSIEGSVSAVVINDGQAVPADMVVLSVGVRPHQLLRAKPVCSLAFGTQSWWMPNRGRAIPQSGRAGIVRRCRI